MVQNVMDPSFIGMSLYSDAEGGFSVWLPRTWQKRELNPGHQGMLFSPDANELNTFFLVENRTLEVEVTKKDVGTLREGFKQGLMSLPGIEILSNDETLADEMQLFDAIYTFLEGEERRIRWMRCLYWGKRQLIFIAQGRTQEDFEHWLPMLYKTMMTPQIL